MVQLMAMFGKAIIILVMLGILYALGSACYFIIKDKADSMRAVKALMWRVGLSIALLLFLVFAYWMGWIQPHPINAGG